MILSATLNKENKVVGFAEEIVVKAPTRKGIWPALSQQVALRGLDLISLNLTLEVSRLVGPGVFHYEYTYIAMWRMSDSPEEEAYAGDD